MNKKTIFLILLAMIFFDYVVVRADWYITISWLDIAMHFAGGFFVALLLAQLLTTNLPKGRLWRNSLVLVGASLFVGVLWEFFEYSLWVYFTHYPDKDIYNLVPTLTDYFDTMSDLAMDISGAFAAAFSIRKHLS